MSVTEKLNVDKKLFLLIFVITFTVFVFTSDGHRYTFDEDVAQQQSLRIATLEPDPRYIHGESRIFFEYPELFPEWLPQRAICKNAILCTYADIGHSITQVPFILINQNFHIITKDIKWTSDDFNNPHYVWWRNSIDPDFTFLELFYGPVFAALSVGTFFLLCRTFDFTRKNSIVLALLFAFSTTLWAYSQTSLNSVPATFFILLGFLFYRKFQKNQSHTNLIICGTSLGFAFLIRNDSVLFIIPLFFILLNNLRMEKEKIKKFFYFVIPPFMSYGIFHLISYARIGSSTSGFTGIISGSETSGIPLHLNIFGMLFSPGVGLLIFAPILFTIFLAFPDFYKKNKFECVLFLSFLALLLIVYGNSESWHGLNAWGERYLLPIIPFLLLPLGASLVKRKSKIFKISIIILGVLGAFFNLVYLVQDVSWFIWGVMGEHRGLYELGRLTTSLWIHPLVLWTFDYSQLTHSIMWAFGSLQPDIFLLKMWGLKIFVLILITILAIPTYLLIRLLQNKSILLQKNKLKL